ncbi:kinase-like protein [Lasiosphaeria ovina]|uniref:non-specific serine/threonine protein kinase n=1 Tax=Lasiosphaeria ovina TaxID=92902 RepID=A0AAE0KCA6_9PEZI|nr:kinase-like protein [Lasiosphaeria ovina]
MAAPTRAYSSSSSSPSQRPPLLPRKFPSSGFEIIDPSIKVEEENLPFYDPKIFYPARIGQVIHDRYQVVAKLGYGTTATTWLCHDLVHHHYVTLKIHVNLLPHVREVDILRYLKTFDSEHEGRNHIRMVDDAFRIEGPHGTHEVLVLPPMSLSLRALQEKMPTGVFDVELAKAALPQVLLALDFLHGVANIDVHAGNLLVGISDDSYLEHFAEAELTRPSARKQVSDELTIHDSQLLMAGHGPLYLCDFGEARIGDEHKGVAMPIQHRAPEILLDVDWDWAIDMWSVGLLAWNLLEPKPLFTIYDADNKELNEAHHLVNRSC